MVEGSVSELQEAHAALSHLTRDFCIGQDGGKIGVLGQLSNTQGTLRRLYSIERNEQSRLEKFHCNGTLWCLVDYSTMLSLYLSCMVAKSRAGKTFKLDALHDSIEIGEKSGHD